MDKNSVHKSQEPLSRSVTDSAETVAVSRPMPIVAPNTGWRVTMIVEAYTPEMFKWGMDQAFAMGREMWIGVEVSNKDDKTARVKVRTTKLRKKAHASTRSGTTATTPENGPASETK